MYSTTTKRSFYTRQKYHQLFRNLLVLLFIGMLVACNKQPEKVISDKFYAVKEEGTIKVYREGQKSALVTQQAKSDHRPFIHPILAPDSEAELTQYSPGHHKHQTGLYWGFTRVNGTEIAPDTLKKWFYKKDKPDRIKKQTGLDYFHHPEDGYWKRVSLDLLVSEGKKIKWQTVYHMMNEEQEPILKETQTWVFEEKDGKFLMSLEWGGEALIDITINEFNYGGMFLRMPWNKEIEGEVVNAARQRNEKAEGQRAMWVDVGMEIEGLENWGHIAIFDHPENDGFPQPWRVDGQLGIGPVRARLGDWHIKKGETATFLHQVVAYSGEHNDVEINALWADYVEDDGMYNKAVLWGIAQKEGREAKLLSPQEAVDEMTIKEGYVVNAFASEPMITQPMAFCWDDKGRMWIAENRDYESRGDGFSNSGDSRILILEDTDRDGVADKRTVFLEGIPFPSAIAVGFDGLYLGAPPNLLFVPDTNGDDKGDKEDIKVLLTGWGIRDRHETINSLHWGPDGWLYGLEGFATPSKIRKPKGKGRIYGHNEAFPEDLLEADGVDINGGVWRYHPTKDRFEAVAHGFSNPWGIDYDAKGQLFISACVIPHMFHVIPGGIYHRQGGQHFNPYVYRDIRTIVDHSHSSAHGGARIYQSDAFPEEQQGRLFMANIHEHAILSDILSTNGSGFTASHGEDFMLANNAQWIGFSMEVGPEGGVYVLDWHDADICGKEVLNKETGRVFRIVPENSLAKDWPGRYEDLNLSSDEELVELQLQTSDWHARRARVILQYRASKNGISEKAINRLMELLKNESNQDYRLRALWTIHVSNAIGTQGLTKLLNDTDEYIRAWAIQLLCEDKDVSNKTLSRFAEMANSEKSSVVRMYLAAALQRIDEDNRWKIAEALVTYADDADDPNIPFMLWFGLEPLVSKDPTKALAIASKSQIPMVTNHISRRLVDADLLEELTASLGSSTGNKLDLLKGMLDGMEGRVDIKEPSNWAQTYSQLKPDKQLAAISLSIAQYYGNATAASEMLALLKNDTATIEDRKNAINSLAAQQRKELMNLLPGLLENKNLRIEAIRAVASFNQRDLGQLLLKKYDGFNSQEKQEAIQTLSSRTVYGRLLASAIKGETMPRKDIPAYIAIQLRRVVGNGFVEIWGPIDQLTGNKKAEYQKYQRLITDKSIGDASPEKGKNVFQHTCAACHRMYGEGGDIGPDLTGSNRTNTAYLLGNIIEPSGVIQDDYKLVVLTSRDGRIYSGNIIEENDRQVTMRIVGQDQVKISKSDIQSREVMEKSMMPEGLLNNLSEEEILDLVAFLKTNED
jgi:putative membrane-bound dehydrogenase-like protein